MAVFPFSTFTDFSVYPCLIFRGAFDIPFQVFDPCLQYMLRGKIQQVWDVRNDDQEHQSTIQSSQDQHESRWKEPHSWQVLLFLQRTGMGEVLILLTSATPGNSLKEEDW